MGKLLKDYKERKENDESGSGESDDNENVGHDDHTIWKETIEKKYDEEQNGEQTSNKKEDDIKENVSRGEKETFEDNKKERKRQKVFF